MRASSWLLPALLLLPLAAGCEDTHDRSAPALYKRSCARCHGDHGQGAKKVKLYPYLNLLASPMMQKGDRTAVRERILKGYGPMPSFRRRLSPQEVERLIDFTLQLSSRRQAHDMDPQRLKDAYQQLQSLDDRLSHKVRPRPGGALVRPTTEMLEQSLRDLATYTLELKDILNELFLAIATTRPAEKPGEPKA